MIVRGSIRLRYLFAALALAIVAASVALSCGPNIPAESEWMSHVRALADDHLEGRDTATRGFRRASDYVARELKRFGVEPAGDSGTYFQRVPFLSRRVQEEKCSLSLVRGRRTTKLTLGTDALFSMKPHHADSFDARLVFVGYGLKVPELGYDDLDGLDLQGAIAVCLSGAPKTIRGPIASNAAFRAEQWRALRAAGAVGFVRIQDPGKVEIPWSRTAPSRLEPALVLDGRRFDETPGAQVLIYWNPNRAPILFEGARHSFASLVTLARDGQRLPRFDLPARLRGAITSHVTPTESRNVIGVIRGSDHKLRSQYVVLSAHLDHLGISTPVDGDSIYNGAMDNASGCATLLEIAREIRRSGHPPKRSILFLFTTGEEPGLLGATYFAAKPTVPRRSMVADLNIDMFLPIQPIQGITAYGIDESDLADDVRRVAKKESLAIVPDPDPTRNFFIRSDQYPFIRKGIPALMIDAGPVDSAGRAAERAWTKDHYHAPSDDAAQEIDLAAVARYDRYVLALTRTVADRPRPPQWNRESYFRRFGPGRSR